MECDVMDMEAYALAKVCLLERVAFTSVKYVTDWRRSRLGPGLENQSQARGGSSSWCCIGACSATDQGDVVAGACFAFGLNASSTLPGICPNNP